VLVLFFTSQNERFLSVRNIFNILADVYLWNHGRWDDFVILTAGVDLSVGSRWPLFHVWRGSHQRDSRIWYAPSDPRAFGGYGWLVALLICLATGTAAGYIQGKASTKLAALRSALGGMTVWRGGTLVALGARRSASSIRHAGGEVVRYSAFRFRAGFLLLRWSVYSLRYTRMVDKLRSRRQS
jgi:ribose/xylose/arabinose/galactoside ABC-type transport system permease subunit